jgi:hypothetical protein
LIDTKALMGTAETSEEGEAFMTVLRSPGLRVGVGARVPSVFFVEVLVDLFPDDRVDLDEVERAVDGLRCLESLGYRLSCRDDHVVCGEKAVLEKEVENEVAAVRKGTAPPEID